MAEHNESGKKGEELAAGYLADKGYNIVQRNWFFGKGEIDIIAEKDRLVIFVEVKTRKSNTFGDPEIFVTRRKQKQIIKTANSYIQGKDIDRESRFDVVAVILSNSKAEIHHIEDAFYP